MRSSRAVFTALVLVAAWAGAAWGQTPTFVPFPQFLADTASATLSQYPQGEVTDPAVFSQMQQYILGTLYTGVHPTSSFVLFTQTFDCVPIMQQPSVRILGLSQIAAPPSADVAPPPNGQGMPPNDVPVASPLTLGLVDPWGNPISCVGGTIPMRRITLDELTSFATLQQFFDKSPDEMDQPPQGKVSPPVTVPVTAPAASEPFGDETSGVAPPPPPQAPAVNNHRYAYGAQNVNNLGGNSWLNLWSPAINQMANQTFSLSQQWYAGGAGNAQQTVEGGWQVAPRKYRTNDAVTFIYWTRANYQPGTGCYNLDCAGFVQVDNT